MVLTVLGVGLVFHFEKGLDVIATEGVGLLLAVVGYEVVVGLVQAHGSGVGAMGVRGDEVDQVMVEEFLGVEAAVEEFGLVENGAGVHLAEATVFLFEGFQGGEFVEVDVTFHMG